MITNRRKPTKICSVSFSGEINADRIAFDLLSSPSIFLPEESLFSFCQEALGLPLDPLRVKYITGLGLLPVHKREGVNVILKNDLYSLLPVLKLAEVDDVSVPRYERLFEQDCIRIDRHSIIDLMHDEPARDPTFFSATRNLISAHSALAGQTSQIEFSLPYFSNSRLTTISEKIYKLAKAQLHRSANVDMSTTSEFAQSAHYMGSKRLLCGFLVEAISSVLPESGVVVDLMCGSGVASGAFSRMWRTFSSDAQQFCRVLSVIHGGGFNRAAAKKLVDELLPIAEEHFNVLQEKLAPDLKTEDNYFCRDTDEALLADYREFLRGFPTLPNRRSSNHWNPQIEVERRKQNPSLFPYCLFTAYFSNVYFGLRQCVEIDSLRFAIDQVKGVDERTWSLGALVATLSALGTIYGGHFAQPIVRSHHHLTLNGLPSVLDKRSSSITHEFAVRLLNLAEQSENSPRRIETIEGPWKHALSKLGAWLKGDPVLVYLDAPYKREEFSRYYHVLETLVSYNYPSCTGTGLTPRPDDRFKSEFFTRVEKQVTETLVRIITEIVERGWICAWSYSDSGAANICKVVELLHEKQPCEVRSYSAPFVHKSQRGAKPKRVTEFLMLFLPKGDKSPQESEGDL